MKKLTLTPTKITQADVDAILNAGWNEQAFYYIVSICGFTIYMSRLIDGYGVKLKPQFRNQIGEMIAKNGYK